MKIKKARQILKSFADDTRLRIINLLFSQELAVADIAKIIGVKQSNLSKHLSRLRLTGIAVDRRQGLNVYYSLKLPLEKAHQELLNVITSGLSESKTFKNDLANLNKIIINNQPLRSFRGKDVKEVRTMPCKKGAKKTKCAEKAAPKKKAVKKTAAKSKKK